MSIAADTPLDRSPYRAATVLIVGLFLMWGIANSLNDVLVAQFRKAFRLGDFESGLVQSAFYVGYFVFAIPASVFMRRYGYRAAVILGLLLDRSLSLSRCDCAHRGPLSHVGHREQSERRARRPVSQSVSARRLRVGSRAIGVLRRLFRICHSRVGVHAPIRLSRRGHSWPAALWNRRPTFLPGGGDGRVRVLPRRALRHRERARIPRDIRESAHDGHGPA